jgi:hypothetical protein
MQSLAVRLLTVVLLVMAGVATFVGDASSQGRPKTYCQCVQSCDAGKQRCERNFDEYCAADKKPQPANCEPAFRKRCDQAAAVCRLDCGTNFRATSC